MVESILYPKKIYALSLDHGTNNEKNAIKDLEKLIQKRIDSCGMFVDSEYQFLSATPDGLIDLQGLVEVKCPWSAANLTPKEAIDQRKITFWLKDGTINIKHKSYYQVQGQLHITNRRYCVFATWTTKGIKYDTIMRDDEFWKRNMEDKLKKIYFDRLFPELIDSRKLRNMDIREPTYILKAIHEKKHDKNKKNLTGVRSLD